MQNLLFTSCLECYSCFNFVLAALRKHFWILKPKSKFRAGRPKAEWRWKAFFGKTSNFDSEARNRFQYTKIEREVKNNNVYHYPGLEFQYNQLSFWTRPSKYAKMQRYPKKIWTTAFSHTLTASFRSSIDYIEAQVLDSDKHCYSLLFSQFWCTETYFLLQNRNLKFCQKTTFSVTQH